MNDNMVAVGILLWIIAFLAMVGGASAGILGLFGGVVIAGFLGLFGFVLVIGGLIASSSPRTCYVCGMVLTSSSDYDRHMATMHPGGRPSTLGAVPAYGRQVPQSSQMAYCPNCAQMLWPTDVFCSRCGTRMTAVAAAAGTGSS